MNRFCSLALAALTNLVSLDEVSITSGSTLPTDFADLLEKISPQLRVIRIQLPQSSPGWSLSRAIERLNSSILRTCKFSSVEMLTKTVRLGTPFVGVTFLECPSLSWDLLMVLKAFPNLKFWSFPLPEVPEWKHVVAKFQAEIPKLLRGAPQLRIDITMPGRLFERLVDLPAYRGASQTRFDTSHLATLSSNVGAEFLHRIRLSGLSFFEMLLGCAVHPDARNFHVTTFHWCHPEVTDEVRLATIVKSLSRSVPSDPRVGELFDFLLTPSVTAALPDHNTTIRLISRLIGDSLLERAKELFESNGRGAFEELRAAARLTSANPWSTITSPGTQTGWANYVIMGLEDAPWSEKSGFVDSWLEFAVSVPFQNAFDKCLGALFLKTLEIDRFAKLLKVSFEDPSVASKPVKFFVRFFETVAANNIAPYLPAIIELLEAVNASGDRRKEFRGVKLPASDSSHFPLFAYKENEPELFQQARIQLVLLFSEAPRFFSSATVESWLLPSAPRVQLRQFLAEHQQRFPLKTDVVARFVGVVWVTVFQQLKRSPALVSYALEICDAPTELVHPFAATSSTLNVRALQTLEEWEVTRWANFTDETLRLVRAGLIAARQRRSVSQPPINC